MRRLTFVVILGALFVCDAIGQTHLPSTPVHPEKAPAASVTLKGKLLNQRDLPAVRRQVLVAPSGCCQNCGCRSGGVDYCCNNKNLACCAGRTAWALTDADGNFSLKLPPGEYDVYYQRMEKPRKLKEELDLTAGETKKLELKVRKTYLYDGDASFRIEPLPAKKKKKD